MDHRLASQRGWLAHLVTRTLQAAGAAEISYDADEFLLRFRSVDGSPMAANLTHLFADCMDASADERAAHIDRFVATLTATPDVPGGVTSTVSTCLHRRRSWTGGAVLGA